MARKTFAYHCISSSRFYFDNLSSLLPTPICKNVSFRFLLVNEKNEKRVLSMAGSNGAVLQGNQFLVGLSFFMIDFNQ